MNFPRCSFMRKEKEYQRSSCQLPVASIQLPVAGTNRRQGRIEARTNRSYWLLTAGNRQLFHPASSRMASRKTFGVVVDVFGRGGGRHQRHVVEGREQNAAIHGVEMQEAFEFEIHGIVSFGSILGRVGAEQILGADR